VVLILLLLLIEVFTFRMEGQRESSDMILKRKKCELKRLFKETANLEQQARRIESLMRIFNPPRREHEARLCSR